MTNTIAYSDNLDFLRHIPDNTIDLIYIDPPFDTGKVQTKTSIKTVRDDDGDRTGFGGQRYRTETTGSISFPDRYDDYFGFLRPRLLEAKRVLTPRGSLFFHIDSKKVHYCKVLLDEIFGEDSYKNEIIWAWDFGGKSKRVWATKHQNILWYAKTPSLYCFNYEEIDRIPYMAPSLSGEEKARRGKVPTDVWWHTIVGTNSREKTGYPTQKPLGIIKRIVSVHSKPGDTVLDFFAGSGTLGEAAGTLGRSFILVDSNPKAIEVMKKRLAPFEPTIID